MINSFQHQGQSLSWEVKQMVSFHGLVFSRVVFCMFSWFLQKRDVLLYNSTTHLAWSCSVADDEVTQKTLLPGADCRFKFAIRIVA